MLLETVSYIGNVSLISGIFTVSFMIVHGITMQFDGQFAMNHVGLTITSFVSAMIATMTLDYFDLFDE